jgi:putative hydrolase
LKPSITKTLDIRIAGLHSRAFTNGTVTENTDAIINAMQRPDIDIISHPVDGTADLDIRAIVQCSAETKTLLELNNSSLRPGRDKPKAKSNFIEMLGYCKEMNVPIIMGSDAHITYDVANHTYAYGLAQEVGFPDELILNGDETKFLNYLTEIRESK